MAEPRRFLVDTSGATADWLVLSAGIALLGAVTVHQVFLGGTDELVSKLNRDLASAASLGSAVNGPPASSTDSDEACEALSEEALAELEVAKECDRHVDLEALPQ